MRLWYHGSGRGSCRGTGQITISERSRFGGANAPVQVRILKPNTRGSQVRPAYSYAARLKQLRWHILISSARPAHRRPEACATHTHDEVSTWHCSAARAQHGPCRDSYDQWARAERLRTFSASLIPRTCLIIFGTEKMTSPKKQVGHLVHADARCIGPAHTLED